MAEKKSRVGGLGRGLDAIFIDNTSTFDGDVAGEGKGGGVIMMRLSDMEPRRDQPRKVFDTESLSSLADSIAANGLIQPIVVRATPSGFYQIIAGERRWRASKMAGLTDVPVIIMQLDDRRTAELALIENLQREDLNPVEEASAYKSLISEYGLTQDEVSKCVGKSRSAVANSMRLLELPDNVVAMLTGGVLSAGHARALLGLKDASLIEKLADSAVARGMSVRQVEKAVRSANEIASKDEDDTGADKDEKSEAVKVDYNAEVERRLTESLGRRVKLSNSDPKKPHMVIIEYSDNDDLDELIKKLTT